MFAYARRFYLYKFQTYQNDINCFTYLSKLQCSTAIKQLTLDNKSFLLNWLFEVSDWFFKRAIHKYWPFKCCYLHSYLERWPMAASWLVIVLMKRNRKLLHGVLSTYFLPPSMPARQSTGLSTMGLYIGPASYRQYFSGGPKPVSWV
jgi:hypothetical protein